MPAGIRQRDLAMSKPDASQSAAWAPIVGVVVAGAISTANAPGHWDPLNSAMGLLLIASLHYFERDNAHMRRSLLYASAYAFCLLMVIGIVYESLMALAGLHLRPALYVINSGPEPGEAGLCWPRSAACWAKVQAGLDGKDFVIWWSSIGLFALWVVMTGVILGVQRGRLGARSEES